MVITPLWNVQNIVSCFNFPFIALITIITTKRHTTWFNLLLLAETLKAQINDTYNAWMTTANDMSILVVSMWVKFVLAVQHCIHSM